PHQEGGHKMDFFNSNGELRGMKRDLYEGGIRVPLIVRWPGRIAASTISDHISGFQDILPTMAAIAGTDSPAGIDGISMLPVLTGQKDQPAHDFLYWEFSEQKGKRAVLKGDWKLVQSEVATGKPSAFRLYDLDHDIGEEKNVAAEHPDKVAELKKLLDGAHDPSGAYPLFPSERK
ncbi:MAG: sulfatase-like hydrolase/transferase, partial [Fuerstiella sp.]|nr:sulfatase-like hydrolase/transferase [Fuerstiella sp.]